MCFVHSGVAFSGRAFPPLDALSAGSGKVGGQSPFLSPGRSVTADPSFNTLKVDQLTRINWNG